MHLPDVVRDPDPGDRVDAGLRIDVDFDDGRRVGVRGRRTHAGAAVTPRRRWRRVRPDGPERPELRLGQDDRFRERHPPSGVLRVEDAPPGSVTRDSGIASFSPAAATSRLLRALRRLDGRVAGHERDARGVGPEIHGCQVRVSGHDADVDRVDAEDLADDRRQDRIGALPDLGRAAEHGHSPAAVELELHARLRHRVPVDRQPGAAEVRRAGEAEAPSERKLAPALLPAGRRDHLVDARAQADRADPQEVGGQRVRRLEVAAADLGRVEAEVAGDPVELNLHGEARLRRPVAALGAAGRLVREDARSVETVGRHLVGHRLQRARVVRRGHAVGAVAAAVEERLEMHRRDRPVPPHARADLHQRRMTARGGSRRPPRGSGRSSRDVPSRARGARRRSRG